MNKQIEEMANIINEMDEPNAHYYTKNMVMREAFADCFTIAKHLYNAGYRKQSEGEWIFHKDGSGTCNQCRTTQKNVWDMDNFQSYCGHCGAKMKGDEGK